MEGKGGGGKGPVGEVEVWAGEQTDGCVRQA